MKLPVTIYTMLTFAVVFAYNPSQADWQPVAWFLAAAALVTVAWTHRRVNR